MEEEKFAKVTARLCQNYLSIIIVCSIISKFWRSERFLWSKCFLYFLLHLLLVLNLNLCLFSSPPSVWPLTFPHASSPPSCIFPHFLVTPCQSSSFRCFPLSRRSFRSPVTCKFSVNSSPFQFSSPSPFRLANFHGLFPRVHDPANNCILPYGAHGESFQCNITEEEADKDLSRH